MESQYKQLIDEILELPNYDMKQVARELRAEMPTLLRLYHGDTKRPRADLASAIFRLHVYARPDLWGYGSGWDLQLSLKNKSKYSDREPHDLEENVHVDLGCQDQDCSQEIKIDG